MSKEDRWKSRRVEFFEIYRQFSMVNRKKNQPIFIQIGKLIAEQILEDDPRYHEQLTEYENIPVFIDHLDPNAFRVQEEKAARVTMFRPEFEGKILLGQKRQTVRRTPKRPIRRGQILDMRKWTGKPYASKQVKIFCTRVQDVRELQICSAEKWVTVCGLEVCPEEFAKADGFDDLQSFFDAFESEEVFKGTMISW